MLSPGQTDKLPDQLSAMSALSSGMCQTKREDVMNSMVGEGRGGEKEAEAEDDCRQLHMLQPKKSFTQGNICELNCGENVIILIGP